MPELSLPLQHSFGWSAKKKDKEKNLFTAETTVVCLSRSNLRPNPQQAFPVVLPTSEEASADPPDVGISGSVYRDERR